MRTLAKILRTVGGWLTWPGWAYAAPRHFGPWRYYYRYPSYRYPSTSDGAADTPAVVARPIQITFTGVSHVAFTVTDLDASQRFYTEVLDFIVVMDVGYSRICMHPGTGFALTLLRHEGAHGGPFTELRTGLDHLGLVASSREELEAWERHFDEHGVTYTPIRDMEMGYHLNFRDPDGIALEFDAPNELAMKAQRVMASGHTTPAEIAAFVAEHFGPEYVPASRPGT